MLLLCPLIFAISFKESALTKMVSTPNFNQLKAVCGSHELKHCFKALFVQEDSDNERLITKIVESCDELRAKIGKFVNLIQKAQTFIEFDVGTSVGLECLMKAHVTNGLVLQALVGVLDVAREGKAEKRRHGMVMEVHH